MHTVSAILFQTSCEQVSPKIVGGLLSGPKKPAYFPEGKKADILIFDGALPSMVVASKRDPVAAIVFHSSIRDLSIVFVDGVMRKSVGNLLAIEE